ncbi:MAG: hypothetical protein AMXMBFR82_32380 [Candidatus Hydrogenedentota bacterium]
MNRWGWGIVCIAVTCGLVSCSQPSESGDPSGVAPASDLAPAGPTFAKDIAPMFKTSCANCHSDSNRKGDLSLATFASTMEGGESGAVIVAGDPDGSLLFRMVTKQEEPYMPRKGDPLTDAQIATLRSWIQNGASES